MTCAVTIELTTEPLDPTVLLQRIADPDCGAQLLFLGCTRKTTGDRTTDRLTYQAYDAMARAELQQLADQATAQWPLRHLTLQHRLGVVAVGEASVAVAASSPHRRAVMEAVPWLMDRLKQTVPIWKQETYSDGSTEWVHP